MSTIIVTPEHVMCGKSRSAQSCPVALACFEAGAIDPVVDSDLTWEDKDGCIHKQDLPDDVQDFIYWFDGHREPDMPVEWDVLTKPVQFELDESDATLMGVSDHE